MKRTFIGWLRADKNKNKLPVYTIPNTGFTVEELVTATNKIAEIFNKNW